MSKPVPLTTEPRLRKAFEMLGNAGAVGFDTESIGPSLRNSDSDFINIYRGTMMGFSFAFDDGTAFYAPLYHRGPGNVAFGVADKLIDAIFNVGEVWSHNAKHDYQTLRLAGYRPSTDTWVDSAVACWLQRGINRENGLKDRVRADFGEERETFDTAFWTSTPSEAAPYACQDAIDTLRLGQHYLEKMNGDEKSWFLEYESPLVFPIGDMEMTGIGLDLDRLADLHDTCSTRSAQIEKEMSDLTGGLVAAGSSKDLQLFFARGHWPEGRRNKEGFSTNREALERVLDDSRTTNIGRTGAELVLEYRKVTKIATTYSYPLAEKARQYPDGKVHASLNPRGAATGRFTSRDPNQQNFPARGELAAAIRRCFVASPGYTLLGADLSQIEYRLLAHFCGGEMAQSYREGKDLHTRTGGLMGISRDDAKTVNFCRIYGGSDRKVFQILGRRDVDALQRLDGFLAANVDFDEEVAQALRERSPEPYIKTISGRRKVLYEPGSPARVFRQAKNGVVQGSAADVMKVGIVNMWRAAGNEWTHGIRPQATIHDELVFEVEPNSNWGPVLEECMTNMPEEWGLTVPLVAEAKEGETWADLK